MFLSRNLPKSFHYPQYVKFVLKIVHNYNTHFVITKNFHASNIPVTFALFNNYFSHMIYTFCHLYFLSMVHAQIFTTYLSIQIPCD